MSAAEDIVAARALFEKAERSRDPQAKVQALDEALARLSSCDPNELGEAERRLIANLRLSHTRRLLEQLVALDAPSMDEWFAYIDLLLGELRGEVEALVALDARLRESYERFLGLCGPQVAELLRRQAPRP